MPIAEENLLTTASEILIRLAHPRHMDDCGRVTTLAFKSSSEHDFGLSVIKASATDPESATKRHLELGRPTHSAWGVSVDECTVTGQKAYDDHDEHVPAHALIDQKPLTTSALKKAATKLGCYARDRGCLCLASDVSEASESDAPALEGLDRLNAAPV